MIIELEIFVNQIQLRKKFEKKKSFTNCGET